MYSEEIDNLICEWAQEFNVIMSEEALISLVAQLSEVKK